VESAELVVIDMTQSIQVYKIDRSDVQPLEFDLPDFDSITTALPTGLYTTFRTYAAKTRVIGLRAHLDRLYLPAKAQGIVPALRRPEDLRMILSDVLTRLDAAEARVRFILDMSSDEQGTMYVMLQAMNPLPAEIYTDGVHVEISKSSREKPSLKRTSFIAESAFERKKVGGEIFEILLTSKARVLEGMTSNFFYVTNGTLCTAGRGILIGITRQTVIAIAKGLGIEICYRALPLNELDNIQEAFITSSSRGVVPVVQVDDRPIGDGKVGETTTKLMHLYEEEVLSLAEEILPPVS
jgi:branched-chain amino acid aminotransferase